MRAGAWVLASVVVLVGCAAEPDGLRGGEKGDAADATADVTTDAATGDSADGSSGAVDGGGSGEGGEGGSSDESGDGGAGGPAFEQVGAIAGVDAPHEVTEGHYAIGQAWGDYDGDGWLDLYVTGGATASVLYRNAQDGTFEVSPLSPSVALESVSTAGATWADYDNDGWVDLYVVAMGPNVLFRNIAGQGLIAVPSGLEHPGDGEMAAWGDYDGDGQLDVYVANHYVDQDVLFRNLGNGTFEDVSGLVALPMAKPAFAPAFLDYDNDGDLDLYVVNDHETKNDLWRNDGPGCGSTCLVNVSAKSGAGVAVHGMGIAVGDYDNDGDLDLYMSDIQDTVLLRNETAQGLPVFVDVTEDAGVGFPAISWGTVFFDYDNDGWLDLYLATQDMELELRNPLFRNLGDGTFANVTDQSGCADGGYSYGVAYADYDGDGWLDLVVGNRGQQYRLYQNRRSSGSGNHALTVALEGGGPINRDAIGARVTIERTDGVRLMRDVRSGSSLGAGDSARLHFGLGSAGVDHAEIVWPDGVTEVVAEVPTDTLWHRAYPQ